ncbi:MAG: type IV toxin-antitoxin system AbiEi family antitoxin [Kiritimatiellae bacterium]|nr:type IV toxin-antitoxin system AbiEi family antitoxin [Kiritimatiellia bacterium]MCO5067261.1 type IV toxin-antitoxin system AbiEi family antitoxin [Kiritimatiellia bacterium]
MDSKLNRVLTKLSPGVVATQAWLEKLGVYRQLTQRYVASGWIKKLGHGAFVRSGDSVDWLGAVYALQEQLNLRVHVAADTALQLKGLGHFLPLGGKQVVHLFGDPGTALPSWFTRHSWNVQVRYHQPRLFDNANDAGFGDIKHGPFPVRSSSPERSIFEVIYLATNNPSLEHAHELLSGLSTLRPDEIQALLHVCRSVRVKRYFLWSAETIGHAWFAKVNTRRVDLGSGKRQLFKGGVYDAKYRITVPPVKEGLPSV